MPNAAERPLLDGSRSISTEAILTTQIPQVHGYAAEEERSAASSVYDDVDVEDDADFQSQYSADNQALSDDSPEDSDDQGPEDDDISALQRPFRHSTGSLQGLNMNAFAPPFYNRPPTPLPPSPSLTSLLRPPFSTTTSRPTTPDSSDVEATNDTEAAVAKSARQATTVPRASPKVPTYEYYGFVLYLASSLAFCKWPYLVYSKTSEQYHHANLPTTNCYTVIYILWSYLPSPFLHQLGIYYYPNRWWSLAIPAWLVMFLVYIYIALASYNTGYLTLSMNSIENIVDEVANVAVVDSKGRRRPGGSTMMKSSATSYQITAPHNRKVNWREVWNEGTDAVMDIPVGGVCEILYGQEREKDEALGE